MKKIKLWKNRYELSDKVALVDDEDYEKVVEAIKYKSGKPGKWYDHRPGGYKNVNCIKHYAVDGDRRKAIHRVVMNAPPGMDVDHINGDPLDNRKENLRLCTRSQNAQNKKRRRDSKSGFKCVYYTSSNLKKPWMAYISDPDTLYPNKRSIKLGYYETAEEAARAYDKKAIEMYGEFAYTNFPIEDYKLWEA
tara:strand:- start:147 stop:722 length:576 start_codon:yes stop_codon:yes gene_type:complete